jgi:hypothetical protein
LFGEFIQPKIFLLVDNKNPKGISMAGMDDLFEYSAVTVIYNQDGCMSVPNIGLVERGMYSCVEFNHRLTQLIQYGWEVLAITSRKCMDRERMAEDYYFRRKKGETNLL